MAIEDKTKQGLVCQGVITPVAINVPQAETHRLEISDVEVTSDADWREAHIAIDMFETAKMDPCMVAKGLRMGHDYPGMDFTFEGVPMGTQQKLQDYATRGNALVSYKIEEAQTRLLQGERVYVNTDENSLVVASMLPETVSNRPSTKVIKMAIIRRKVRVEAPQIYSFGALPLDKAA